MSEWKDGITLRRPTVEDARAMHTLVAESPVLDTNSVYSYLMWCRDFSDTSVVAQRENGSVIGFVSAYRRPAEENVLFAWQTATDPEDRVPGLPTAMFSYLARRTSAAGVTHLETTVNPGNRAVIMMINKWATSLSAPVLRNVLFDSADFGSDHPDEILYRVGPFSHAHEEVA
ncbi:diaminobutyrate acetyltransferase [Streptomyces sp. TRM 70351]|uniref:diaminobutyrate acetyltransferase n=1 Tax=Streptomyces sp. TRM 70351 TaxID=3116552 RepID=UPI002E7AB5A7|nr:diaminobutyrate acetyltransferase [Streptomyces sp. TRM 70351]MEE1927848.1 diaminobutyrate acetyltransferase [Streptomyces sp. TRM 70351]